MHAAVVPLICRHWITRDLCSPRPPHAEFSRTSLKRRLGHTGSGRIWLAKVPFIPAAVARLSSQVRELLSPVCSMSAAPVLKFILIHSNNKGIQTLKSFFHCYAMQNGAILHLPVPYFIFQLVKASYVENPFALWPHCSCQPIQTHGRIILHPILWQQHLYTSWYSKQHFAAFWIQEIRYQTSLVNWSAILAFYKLNTHFNRYRMVKIVLFLADLNLICGLLLWKKDHNSLHMHPVPLF